MIREEAVLCLFRVDLWSLFLLADEFIVYSDGGASRSSKLNDPKLSFTRLHSYYDG
jgi:hypothetical protein